MKILKIFGVVVGIHVLALILIFVSPGCSASNKPSPAEIITKTDETPPAATAAPAGSEAPVTIARADAGSGVAPISFDPNAPATATVRFSPTRPGTSAASALEAQPVADVTPASTYTVGRGDSMWTIAHKHHVTIAELAKANNMKSGATVHIGQKLIIPGKATGVPSIGASEPAVASAAAPEAAHASAPSGESVKHVVKPGETLGAIARKYQVKVGEIATANNISDPAKIRPGMELTIPGWQAPSGKSHSAKGNKAKAASESEPAATPAVVPPPDQDLDAGLKPTANEPPVIKVEDKP